MKTIKKIVVLIGATILSATASYAQLKITGEVRPRFEYLHGFQTLADSAMRPGVFVDQRTRINFEYKKEKIEFIQENLTFSLKNQLFSSKNTKTKLSKI